MKRGTLDEIRRELEVRLSLHKDHLAECNEEGNDTVVDYHAGSIFAITKMLQMLSGEYHTWWTGSK